MVNDSHNLQLRRREGREGWSAEGRGRKKDIREGRTDFTPRMQRIRISPITPVVASVLMIRIVLVPVLLRGVFVREVGVFEEADEDFRVGAIETGGFVLGSAVVDDI